MKFGVVFFPDRIAITTPSTPSAKSCTSRSNSSGISREDLSGFDADHSARRIFLRRLSAHRSHRAIFAGDARRRAIRARAAAWCSASATAFRFFCEAGLLPGALHAQPRPALHLPSRARSRRNHGHAVYLRRQPGPGAAHSHRARATAIISATTPRSPNSSATIRSCSATARPTAQHRPCRESQRFARRHRRRLQSRAQRGRADAASGARRGIRAGLDRRPGVFRSLVGIAWTRHDRPR